jgi:hypothetical protein
MKSEIKKITTYKDFTDSFNYIGISQGEKLYMQFRLYTYPLRKKNYNTGIWKIKWKQI